MFLAWIVEEKMPNILKGENTKTDKEGEGSARDSKAAILNHSEYSCIFAWRRCDFTRLAWNLVIATRGSFRQQTLPRLLNSFRNNKLQIPNSCVVFEKKCSFESGKEASRKPVEIGRTRSRHGEVVQGISGSSDDVYVCEYNVGMWINC